LIVQQKCSTKGNGEELTTSLQQPGLTRGANEISCYGGFCKSCWSKECGSVIYGYFFFFFVSCLSIWSTPHKRTRKVLKRCS